MYSTVNCTTSKVGQCQATVICDSIHDGKRITTLELLYPRYIHAELLTHRVQSRNSSSSRATPIAVLTKDVKEDPVFFDYVGKNQSGMVAGAELSPEEKQAFYEEWCKLAKYTADWVLDMQERFDIHKQTLNRVLEPFSRIRTLVTSTEWDNFFELRLAKDAQPEMQSLAKAMKSAMDSSTPVERSYHCPYTEDVAYDSESPVVKCSVARCARVSYGRLNEKTSNLTDDILLYDKLWSSKHLSPFEHVAFAEEGQHANFNGWKSLRKIRETLGSAS